MEDETILDISNQRLTTLPGNLPQSLINLYCSENKLTSLPDNLPHNLWHLICYNNQLTSLPNNLPQSLKELWCNNNKLTSLPEHLPPNLKILYCTGNELISLPDKLPQNLIQLMCNNNQLTILPDLPSSIKFIYLKNNPLDVNYPDIFNFKNYDNIVTYVNKRNREMRLARMQKIDPEKRILELYMKRMMHPSRLAALADDADADIDEWMTRYVESL